MKAFDVVVGVHIGINIRLEAANPIYLYRLKFKDSPPPENLNFEVSRVTVQKANFREKVEVHLNSNAKKSRYQSPLLD